jgi:DinB family protein
MTDDASYLRRQFKTAWLLTDLHLTGLSTEECLWRPAAQGMHVHRAADGTWRADWPEHERYDLGPSSIAWITWHIGFWWSMVLDHAFGTGKLTREAVTWPGTADNVREQLGRLRDEWIAALDKLSDTDLQSTQLTRWPFRDRPFGDVVAWVNIELTKNAAELGYARFLYAVRR